MLSCWECHMSCIGRLDHDRSGKYTSHCLWCIRESETTSMEYEVLWLPSALSVTRCLENDNTPQPLDQWTNSPFMGQQVGNCKSFTLTHYLANLFAMHRGPRPIPLYIQHIQLAPLSFQVNPPSHSWDMAISIFYLENPRSRSWVRSKLKVTTWV